MKKEVDWGWIKPAFVTGDQGSSCITDDGGTTLIGGGTAGIGPGSGGISADPHY